MTNVCCICGDHALFETKHGNDVCETCWCTLMDLPPEQLEWIDFPEEDFDSAWQAAHGFATGRPS